jgi:hypothetical protein
LNNIFPSNRLEIAIQQRYGMCACSKSTKKNLNLSLFQDSSHACINCIWIYKIIFHDISHPPHPTTLHTQQTTKKRLSWLTMYTDKNKKGNLTYEKKYKRKREEFWKWYETLYELWSRKNVRGIWKIHKYALAFTSSYTSFFFTSFIEDKRTKHCNNVDS